MSPAPPQHADRRGRALRAAARRPRSACTSAGRPSTAAPTSATSAPSWPRTCCAAPSRYKGYRVQRGHEHHRRGRPDHPARRGGGAGPRDASPPPHIRAFEEDMATLRMERPEVVPRATEHIPEMIDAHRAADRARPHLHRRRQRLLPDRHASRSTAGSRGSTSPGIKAGARVDTDKYDKENARDFVLWKAKADEPAWAQWDAPFGRGRPGLAHRVLGHEHEVPGRDLRPALRRRGPHLPAPRERDRAEPVRHRASPSCATGCTSSTC